jgi:hypothetical protein
MLVKKNKLTKDFKHLKMKRNLKLNSNKLHKEHLFLISLTTKSKINSIQVLISILYRSNLMASKEGNSNSSSLSQVSLKK